SIEVSSCRMLALVDTVPTSCVFVCDAFYDTLLLKVIYNTSVTIAVMYFVLNTAYLKSTIALG
ncbi:hypothetical protein SAMN05444271_1041, partial [Halohasta litchfieldiae]